MASTRGLEAELSVRLVVDDRTRAALVALGWTPPAAEDDGADKDLMAAQSWDAHENNEPAP